MSSVSPTTHSSQQPQQPQQPQLASSGASSPTPSSVNTTNYTQFNQWPKLNLNLCLLDPPNHRKAIEQAENACAHFETQLKSIMKLVKANLEVQKMAIDKHHTFTIDLMKHSLDISSGDLLFNSFINRLNDEFNMYQEIHLQYVSLTQHLLINSITDYIAQHFTPLKDLKKKFEQVTESLDSALDKYLSKKYNDALIPELARDVADLRLLFHTASLDYCTQLNHIYYARKPDWMQRVYEYLGITNSFHSQTFHLFKQLMTPRVANFTSLTLNCKSQSDTNIHAQDQLKSRLLHAYANTYNPLNKGLFDTIKAVTSAPSSPTFTATDSTQDNLDESGNCTGDPVLKSGYLLKRNQAQRMRASWSRRFFMIRGELLVYQQREKEPEPIVAVNLRVSTVKPIDMPSSERRFTFAVMSANKTYTLQAENEEDMNGWIDALQKGINDALHSSNPVNTSGMSNKGKKETLAAAKLGTSGPIEVNPSILNANRALEAQKEILTRIRAVEGNTRCADCMHEDPEWCSINLGVVLCIECSGIHRSFGTSVSKVRSLILDKWEPDNIACMIQLGNMKMNTIYLRLCKDPPLLHSNVPSGGSGRTVRESFLRRKYIDKEWISKDAIMASLASNSQPPISIHEALWNAVCYSHGDFSLALGLHLIGADLDWQHPSHMYRTCLHHVIEAKDCVAAEFVFQLGCNVNIQDQRGWAPLHCAASTCNNQLAHRLIRRFNADWRLKDVNGQTALDIAISKEDPLITTMLRLVELDAHAGFSKLGITEALSDTNAAMKCPDVQQHPVIPTLPQRTSTMTWSEPEPVLDQPAVNYNSSFADGGFANFPPTEPIASLEANSSSTFAPLAQVSSSVHQNAFAAEDDNPWG